MKSPDPRRCPPLCGIWALLLMPISPATGATLVPAWSNDVRTTSTLFTFSTASRTAPPETFSNPYGSVALLVQDDTNFGTGWQDPGQPLSLTRDTGAGAWDLGKSGKISVTIPVAPSADGSIKTVDVFVNFIWYQAIVSAPQYRVEGLTPVSQTTEQERVALESVGSWQRTVWSATFANVTADSITLVFDAPANGSVIDDLSIYTRYAAVPEPGTAVMMSFGILALTLRRRTRGAARSRR